MKTSARIPRFIVACFLMAALCSSVVWSAEPEKKPGLWPEGTDKAIDMSDKKIAGQLEEVKGNAADPAAGLLSSSVTTRRETQQRILEDRKKLIARLMEIASAEDADQHMGGSMDIAVQLLGNLRAVEAITVLSDHLMFVPVSYSGAYEGGHEVESYYPCAVALANLGEPVIGRMRYLIEMSDSAEKRNLAAWVILQIEGKDRALELLSKWSNDEVFTAEARTRDAAAHDYLLNRVPMTGHPLVPKRKWTPMLYNPK